MCAASSDSTVTCPNNITLPSLSQTVAMDNLLSVVESHPESRGVGRGCTGCRYISKMSSHVFFSRLKIVCGSTPSIYHSETTLAVVAPP